MSDYTPTTWKVRDSYISDNDAWWPGVPDNWLELKAAEFDRWLVEYTRKTAEQAWDEGWHTGNADSDELNPTVNPYREESK